MNALTFPISKFFPKSSYRASCLRNKPLTPIYLLALRQPDDNILVQYRKFQRDPNYAEPEFKLTALTVAVLVRNHFFVDYLQNQRNVKPDPVDLGGLPPLHYACALKDSTSVQLLQKAKNIQTTLEIFPSWKKVINPPIPNRLEKLNPMIPSSSIIQ